MTASSPLRFSALPRAPHGRWATRAGRSPGSRLKRIGPPSRVQHPIRLVAFGTSGTVALGPILAADSCGGSRGFDCNISAKAVGCNSHRVPFSSIGACARHGTIASVDRARCQPPRQYAERRKSARAVLARWPLDEPQSCCRSNSPMAPPGSVKPRAISVMRRASVASPVLISKMWARARSSPREVRTPIEAEGTPTIGIGP